MAIQKTSLTLLFSPFVFLITSLPALSQSKAFEEMIYNSDSLNINAPREKIFIHRDKPYYKPGDTIWLKGYILTATENIPNDSSHLAYVEIINAQNEIVKRISTPCRIGIFAASIVLHAQNFPQGQYLLRAWTNYLRNFGDSLFYESRFTIVDPVSEEWRTTIHQLSFEANRLIVTASLAAQNSGSIANRSVSVRLRAKNKILFRTRAITDAGGNIFIDTLLKEGDTKNLKLEIAEKDNVKVQLPLKANEKRLIDLQFLPEGGTFIAGMLQRLGFKAINVSGKGMDVKGVIKDDKGTMITTFASLHKGMGIVSFIPQAGAVYTAVLENGLSFQLPLPQPSGISLQVNLQPSSDSIQIRIMGTPDQYGRWVYFGASSKGIFSARGRVIIKAEGYELKMDGKQFLPGISLFTLYDEQLQPVNARAVFIWHNEELNLSLTQHKEEYLKKDSVSLHLKVRDKNGEKITGTFSMAVLDTSQVKVLPNGENLLSYMLLSSDLKGEIEEPYYYFNQPDPVAVEALMLTQGWVSYNRALNPIAFTYEKGYTISGRVSNVFNKSLDGAKLVLFGKAGRNNLFVSDTTTNAAGNFIFNGFDFYDTDSISMLIRALNKNGKAFNVGIDLKEPVYPAVNTAGRPESGNEILIDTIAKQYVANQEKIKAEFKKEGIMLEEVIVKAKFKVPGSKNLNEDGGADQVITEETLNKTPKENLLSILEKLVPGFRLGSPPRSSQLLYKINSNIVRLVIDGVDLHFFFQPVTGMRDEYAVFLESYLRYFNAEDIKGIEIMNSPTYNSTYRSEFLNLKEKMETGPATVDFSFIEITTQTGQGPFAKKTPGMYLLKPLFPVLAKQFYSPKYTSPSQETLFPDLRNTIYWNPEVVTDEQGEAVVSFYTSESNSSSYLVIVQGTDLKGNLGVLYQPVVTRKK